MNKKTHNIDGYFAFAVNGKAIIVGEVKKNSHYLIKNDAQEFLKPTQAELEAELTEKGISFKSQLSN